MRAPPLWLTVWVVVERSTGNVSATPDDGRIRAYATRACARQGMLLLRSPHEYSVRPMGLNPVTRRLKKAHG